mmetsp:Transcript_29664/g.60924  ORF Transcript_29664/g.60924 Transcript_29664/m.60924 type:complete len:698 (+) Transcript_29664:441-2534(+)
MGPTLCQWLLKLQQSQLRVLALALYRRLRTLPSKKRNPMSKTVSKTDHGANAWSHLENANATAPPTPPAFHEALQKHTSLRDIQLKHSTTILGVPFGTHSSRARILHTKAQHIAHGCNNIKRLPKGKTHHQMLKYCIMSQFAYLQRTQPPVLTTQPARVIDDAVFRESTRYGGWSSNLETHDPGAYWGGKLIVQSRHMDGGLGLTPLEGAAESAYYSSWVRFLRWSAASLTALDPSGMMRFDVTDLENATHAPVKEMVSVHNILVGMGAEQIDPINLPSDDESTDEATEDQNLKIPRLADLYMSDHDSAPKLPKQRRVTAFMMRRFKRHHDWKAAASKHSLEVMEEQKMQQISLHTQPTDHQDNSQVNRMNKLLKNRNPGKDVIHCPTAWIGVLDGGKENNDFEQDEWRVWYCQSTGVDNPQVSEFRRRGTANCEGCGKEIDKNAHHLQCCVKQHKGTWQEVHDHLQATWVKIAGLAGFGATANPKNLPRPRDDQSDKHADIYFKYNASDCRAIVGDVTITHPFTGAGRDDSLWGDQVGGRLEKVSEAKDKLYFGFHRDMGYTFLPLAATTYGKLDPHSIRLIWFMTDCACSAYFERKGFEKMSRDGSMTEEYMRLRARFFARYRSRISMSVARGAARRAMLWGVKRGRAKIRVAAPIRVNQDFCEHLPLSGADRMSLSFVCEEGPENEDGTLREHA